MRTGLQRTTPEEARLSPEGLAKIDQALQREVDRGELAGVNLLVARHGKVGHWATLGLKNLQTCEPLTWDTIFRIFSMTKPVTAAAMMILHDEGRWSPDDPIARHLPEFAEVKGPDGKPPAHPPTLRQLMTHTAGFGYGIGPGPHDAVDEGYIAAGVWKAEGLDAFVQRVATLPLAYPPGEAWRYSLAMDLQGAIIERLSGMSLPAFMRERLFAPLGMVDTDFFVPAEKRSRLATLYHMYNVDRLTELTHPSFARDPALIPAIPSGGGGLYSTIDDYSRFAQMLLCRGELEGVRVLSEGAVRLMTSNHLSQEMMEHRYGVGAQQIRPGFGYGFNGAVFVDPVLASSRVGRGTYQWDGAAGTWFWVDWENDLIFVGLIQRMLQDTMTPLQATTQDLLADALV